MAFPEKTENSSSDVLAVEMRNIWKRFPGVIANQAVDFDLRVGEVHALLGENGAGKSTLMNILCGAYRQDEGEIFINGKSCDFRSPAQAIATGIGMIHQHFRLVEKLTVAENIHLGWDDTPWHATKPTLHKRTTEICESLGYNLDPNAKIWQISVGEQQRVEILRVLSRGAQVLILDEPTAVLTPHEADELYRVTRQLANDGKTVVFISHKLDEVMSASDRVTILRHGEKIATLNTADCDKQILANLMVGKNIVFQSHLKSGDKGKAILELKKINAKNDRGLSALQNFDLSINEREILGIAGVAGNGQTELAEVVTGLRPTTSGSIMLGEDNLTNKMPSDFAGGGVGHIPEDRSGTGLIPSRSVRHNAILRKYAHPPIRKGSRLDHQAALQYSKELINKADVRVPGPHTKVATLSGGNQQRLLSGREIDIASRLLVAVHPTRGLDVAATDSVRSVLVNHRNNGCGVLLISEDLNELFAVSDRIAVMHDGQVVGEFETELATLEEIGILMGGGTLNEESNK